MNCPVCNTTELSEDTTTCPQCRSDLEVFKLIVRASEQRQTQKKIVSALGIFATVTAIGWASSGMFTDKAPGSVPPEQTPEITVQKEVSPAPEAAATIALLTKENESLKSENAALTKKINQAKEKPTAKATATASGEGGTIIHTVRNGDTFWIIARKYFHDGTKYKQIAKDNGMTTKQTLHKGMKLKIIVNG